MRNNRQGNVLILVVLMLIGILGVTALVVDLGMARLTQLQLQAVSDSASLEASWGLANDRSGNDFLDTRLAASERATEQTEFTPFDNGEIVDGEPDLGLGPREVLLVDGFDLNGDGVTDAGRTIVLGNRVEAGLNLNMNNSPGGDVVTGVYDVDNVPLSLPPAPPVASPFERGPTFVPATDSATNSVLVRLRRTGSTDAGVENATSNSRLPVLFGAFSQFGTGTVGAFQQRSEGYAVRSESIAAVFPAVAVGPPGSGGNQFPEAIPFAVDTNTWSIIAASINGVATEGLTAIAPPSFTVGANAIATPLSLDALPITGYIAITQPNADADDASNIIVAFGLVHVAAPLTPDSDPVVTLLQASQPQILEQLSVSLPLTGNATADLSVAIEQLNGLSLTQFQQIRQTANQLPGVLEVPRLVRSYRIQGVGTP